MQEIWSRALAHLRATTERPAYDSWLSPIQLLGSDATGVDLGVPDPYFLDYVASNLYEQICRSVHQAADRPLEVRLLVADPSLAHDTSALAHGAALAQARPSHPDLGVSAVDPALAGTPLGAALASGAEPARAPAQAAPAGRQRRAHAALGEPRQQGAFGFAMPSPTPEATQPPSATQATGVRVATGPSAPQRPANGHDYGYRDNLVPSLNFDTFVVGDPNRLAHGAALAVTESPAFNPLFIHGGVGIGKTHLLHAVGIEVRRRRPGQRILYVAAASFIDDFVTAMRSKSPSARSRVRDRYRGADLLLVDDVQFLEGKEKTQEEFFHTFNALHQAGKQIVLTSDRPPAELGAFQDRLRSRFNWGLVAEIAPPDRDMRVTILRAKAEERGAQLTLDVIHYVADHLRNNVRELEGALNKLLLHARISQREVDLTLAREVLGPLMELPGQRLTIDAVQRATVKHFGLRLSDLKGSKRHRAVVEPRMIAMYLARKHTEASYPEIGRAFGGRDHSTVINACKRVKWQLSSLPRIQADLQQLEQALGKDGSAS